MHLDDQWAIATPPTVADLQEDFKVDILSGLFVPWAWRFRSWTKRMGKFRSLSVNFNIQSVNFNVQDGKKCGYFSLLLGEEKIIFDYDLDLNDKSWRRLRDHVRKVTDDYFIGKIYVRIWGKYRYMGYFSLTRIPEIKGGKPNANIVSQPTSPE